jgi:hypothetical protein
MRGSSKVVLIVVVVAVVAAVGCYFAFRGGSSSSTASSAGRAPLLGGPPPGGPPGGPAGAGGQFAGFEEFRKSHQFTFQLSRLASNIGRLDKETKSPVTPDQAKAILAVLTPLRKQESMDQEGAKAAIRSLQKVLTDDQRNAISTMAPEHRFRSAGGSSGGRPSGERPHFDMKAMENFNPFNPPKDSPMYERSKKRMDDLFAALEKKAKGK